MPLRSRALAVVIALSLFSTHAAWAEEQASFVQTFQTEMAALKQQYGNIHLSTGQAGIITSSIYCVVRKAGLSQTIGFYRDAKAVAEHAKPLCDAHMERQAKDYVLNEYSKRKDDPIVAITLDCYQAHAADIASIIPDARKRGQLSSYYRWAKDPAAAQAEMTGQEICH